MVFRILTNGEHWRVQRRKLFRWVSESNIQGCMEFCGNVPIKFNSDYHAVAYIREKYGSSATITRPWVASIATKLVE